MKKLSTDVLQGLIILAGCVEAGSPEDILGEENPKEWPQVLAAVKWIRKQQWDPK